MRKAIIPLICVLLIGLLQNQGFFKDDVSNRTIVQGVGIDINDDGTYSVTLETINTENYSNADGSATPVMNVRTHTGKTVNSAIKSAYTIDGKIPIMSQNRVVIIGKTLAEKGIMQALDFFIRDGENYPSVLIAVTDKSAEDFFKSAADDSRVVSRDAENIILTAEEDITVSGITLCELVNRYESVGKAFYAPIISTEKFGDKQEVVSKGTAVFYDGKAVCNLNGNETAALNFLCNNVKRGNVEFPFDGTFSALSIISSGTVRKLDYSSENPSYNIKIKIKTDLAETGKGEKNGLSTEELDALIKSAEKKLKNDIEALCEKLYFEKKADAAGLSRLIYIHYPEKFREQEKNLSEIMTNSQYSVEVDIKIRRIGQDYSV